MKLLLQLSDIPAAQRVLIYGSGNAGLKFRQVLERFRPDLTIAGYLDSFSAGEKDGSPVYRFADLTAEQLRDVQVLVVSSFWRDIEVALQKKTASYLIVPSRFYQPQILNLLAREAQPASADLCYQYFTGDEWQQPDSLLPEVLALFETETDRQLYRLLTGACLDRAPLLAALSDYFYRGEFGRQYFDFLDFAALQTILEGGVYDGYDSLEFLRQTGFKAALHGFEPDIGSYLGGTYISRLQAYPQVQIRPLGLWSEQATLTMDPCPAASQLLAAGGSAGASPLIEVEVTDIDSFVARQGIDKVDLIKMDIEGAELEALKGAARVIAEHKPQLAICLYHKKEHFIEIPLYLKKLNPDYRFRLGHYNADHTETVLYALVDG